MKIDEAKRFINACDPAFRKLVQAALLTGCRYGELCRITVADLNIDVGTLTIIDSKTGKTRHVILTPEGLKFFRNLCAGKSGDKLMLTHDDGSPWRKSNQGQPMRNACERANIKPRINFHGLRHTYASHSIMGGVPILVVSKNLGHSDSRMVDLFYGHMAPFFSREAIAKGAPRFDIAPPTNVRPIR